MKCDETRPSCRNCVSTGRRCEGPVAPQVQFIQDRPLSRSNSPPTLVPEVSLLAPTHADYERRAVDYFVNRGAPIFAGAFDASFWIDLVPRLAQSRDFVWDAVVSISCLLEHVPYENLVTTFEQNYPYKITNKHHQQALKFYNRAITSVRRLADRDELDESVAVLSCVLFASVEFQQRNVTTATELVKECCRILTQSMSNRLEPKNKSPKATSNGRKMGASDIHEIVAPFVLRKAVLTATLGTFLPPEWSIHHEFKTPIRTPECASPTLNEASTRLYTLLYQCFEVTRVAELVPDVGSDPGKDRFLALREVLLEKLTEWRSWFLDEPYRHKDSAEAGWMCSYLLMYWAVAYTSLEACAYNRQTAFDEHRDHFAAMIYNAEVYLAHLDTSATDLSPFKAEAGVLPTLYFCAMKCRDPVLRREALRLMRQAPKQDTLWAFVAPDRVVERVISLEERGMNSTTITTDLTSTTITPDSHSTLTPDSHSTLTTDLPHSPTIPTDLPTKWPPEERRFAHVSVLSRDTAGGTQRLALQLDRFIFQADGTRRLVHEYAWLDQDQDTSP